MSRSMGAAKMSRLPRAGSEIKLLRAGWNPFRLGNHYGHNPTIPSFLAISILKRLGITRDKWLDSIAAG